jgi:hypothetical protein
MNATSQFLLFSCYHKIKTARKTNLSILLIMNEDDALGATIGGSKATNVGNIVLGGRVSARLGELPPLTSERLAPANPNAKRKPRKKRKPIFGSLVGILGKKL